MIYECFDDLTYLWYLGHFRWKYNEQNGVLKILSLPWTKQNVLDLKVNFLWGKGSFFYTPPPILYTHNPCIFRCNLSRGTFWANYSTTLGAALHELGHCFDLMHMPEGIMARGFDDMNRFALAMQSSPPRLPPSQSADVTSAVATAMRMFPDHRAHWFRSSAVLLHYHR